MDLVLFEKGQRTVNGGKLLLVLFRKGGKLSFGKSALRGDEVFSLLKRTNTYPEKLICSEIPRKTVKTKFRAAFSKKNARPFFAGGLFLLVMSLFVLFPVYYLVTGASLMITAVLVRAVGYA